MKYLTLTLAALLASAQAYLKPRDLAPDFKNVNSVSGTTFTKSSLSDYEGKYLVVLFYPFDWTYVCPTELIAFSEATAKF
jgi:peroxiredoxin (alkyl hydroperoxide reductase subunit C)